ncbi:MAG: fibronectin type III domain-containing protein [Lachnospiraceae bacterium]|nr:fibronectin type III domain-containing protein [Lachnospiraceae bacterium]
MRRMIKLFAVGTTIASMSVVAAISMKTTANAATVTNIQQTDSSTYSAKIDWDDVTDAQGYNVYLSKNGGNSYERISTSAVDVYSSEKTISGLDSGESYYVKIAAVDSNEQEMEVSDSFEVVTVPEKVTNLRFVGADNNTATIQWDAQKGADEYIVKTSNNTYITSSISYSVPAHGFTSVDVYACNVSESKYYAKSFCVSIYDEVTNLTEKVSTKYFGVYNGDLDSNSINLFAVTCGSGVQFQGFNCVTGKKLFSATEKIVIFNQSAIVNVKKFKKNVPCMYRVRTYVETSNGKKYGKWSSYNYLIVPGKTYVKATKNKFVLKFSKMKNIAKIEVKASKNSDKGFKKVGTLKGNKRILTISKYNKKKLESGTRYYFRVYYTVKDKKGKKHKSNMYVTYSGLTKFY